MSHLEDTLLAQLAEANLPEPVREHLFARPGKRMWRFDFAWPDRKVAVEVEGGTWAQGRHTRGAGFRNDCEKYNAAATMGWCVLRFPAEMVNDGTALLSIRLLLGEVYVVRSAGEALEKVQE